MIKLNEIADKLKKNGKYWIAFTGDSITSCEWVHPNWRDIVQYVLQNEMIVFLNGDWKLSEWGIKGFNFGYDGATTKDILEKLEDIMMIEPDLVIGLMGSNDRIRLPVNEHVKNIENIVQKFNTQVVWSNSICFAKNSKRNVEYESFASASMKIPRLPNLQLIDMFNLYKKFPLDRIFTFKSEENIVEKIKEGDIDEIHPNQLGNAYIAKVVLKEVFNINFDPEKYISTTLSGEKYPKY